MRVQGSLFCPNAASLISKARSLRRSCWVTGRHVTFSNNRTPIASDGLHAVNLPAKLRSQNETGTAKAGEKHLPTSLARQSESYTTHGARDSRPSSELCKLADRVVLNREPRSPPQGHDTQRGHGCCGNPGSTALRRNAFFDRQPPYPSAGNPPTHSLHRALGGVSNTASRGGPTGNHAPDDTKAIETRTPRRRVSPNACNKRTPVGSRFQGLAGRSQAGGRASPRPTHLSHKSSTTSRHVRLLVARCAARNAATSPSLGPRTPQGSSTSTSSSWCQASREASTVGHGARRQLIPGKRIYLPTREQQQKKKK